MKKWAIIAAVSFVATGIIGQNGPNFVSAMSALLFFVSLIIIFFKWIINIIKKHPERMLDDSDYHAVKTVKKQPKTKRATPAPINNIDPLVGMGKQNGEAIRFDIKPDREIEIEYADASGDITRRRVTAQIIETAWGGLVLKAYCHLRGAQRSFKLENIRRVYENGHEIDVVDWLAKIGFTKYRRVKRRIVKQKISAAVDKMSNSALDEFIKNSD